MDGVPDDRLAEALAAVDECVRRYPDVFGSQCWCSDSDCPGECGVPVPSTAGIGGWILIAETVDLDPAGQTSTTYRVGPSTGVNTALGMAWRVARRHC